MGEKRIGRVSIEKFRTEGKNYFLGIGISVYDRRNGLSKLPNAKKDILGVETILVERYKYNRNENIKIIINERATRANLENIFDILADELTEEDSLIIYFAGHGGYDGSRGYWFLYDHNEESGAPAKILDKEIINEINGIGCNSILIVEDRCNGNSIPENASIVSDTVDDRCAQVISSTSIKDLAPDGDEIVQNSPFAHAFIQLLVQNNDEEFHFTKSKFLQIDDKLSTIYIRNIYRGNSNENFLFKLRKGGYPFLKEEAAYNKYYKDERGLNLSMIDCFVQFYPTSKNKNSLLKTRLTVKSASEKRWKKLRLELLQKLAKYNLEFYHDEKYKKEVETVNSLIDQLIGTEKDDILNQLGGTDRKIIENVIDYRHIQPNTDLGYIFSSISYSVENTDWLDSILEYGTSLVSVRQMHHYFIANLEGSKEYIKRYNKKWNSFTEEKLNSSAIYLTRIEAIKFANWYSEKNNLNPYYKLIQHELVGLDKKANGYRLPNYEELSLLLSKPDIAFNFKEDNMSYEWCWDFHSFIEGENYAVRAAVSKESDHTLTIEKDVIPELETSTTAFRLIRNIDLSTID